MRLFRVSRMAPRYGGITLAAITLWSIFTTDVPAFGDAAVTADPFAPTKFILAPGRTAGWQFTVGATLQLTHLGLYDSNADGFSMNYPIGMWDSEGALLASATIPGGAVVPLIEGFRYTAVDAAADTLLIPGETYTIGYYAAALGPDDEMISSAGSHAYHPLVNQVGTVVTSEPSGGLAMPDSPFAFEQWLGPSFQFEIIPTPATLGLVLIGLISTRRGRQA